MWKSSISKESLNYLKMLYSLDKEDKTKEIKAFLNLFKNELKMCGLYKRTDNLKIKENNKNNTFLKEIKEIEYHHMCRKINDSLNEIYFETEREKIMNSEGKIVEVGGERIGINININLLRNKIPDNYFYSDNNGLCFVNGILCLMPRKNEKYMIQDNKLLYDFNAKGKAQKYIYLHHTKGGIFVSSLPI